MSERIVGILGRLRGRLLLARLAEAAAVGATAGAVTATLLMSGRIVVDVAPRAAAGVSCIPLAGGVASLLWPRLRKSLGGPAAVQWLVVALAVVGGAAGAAWALSGSAVFAGKNSLALISPIAGLIAAALVLLRGESLATVAVAVDRRADLKARLATALELAESGQKGVFADQVQAQVLSDTQRQRIRGVRFWTRSRATVGALVLSVLAMLLMLPWEPIESEASRQRRQWAALAPAAAGDIEDSLAGLDAAAIRGLTEQIGRLEAMAADLRTAKAIDSEQWRGKVVELDALAEVLRGVLRSGQVDSATAERLKGILRAVEQASAALAGPMGSRFVRRGPVDPTTLPAATRSAPVGWTSVYNPAYAEFASTRPAVGSENPAPPALAAPFDRQWLAARRAAAESLRRQSAPAEYRQLIRDFFATDDSQ